MQNYIYIKKYNICKYVKLKNKKFMTFNFLVYLGTCIIINVNILGNMLEMVVKYFSNHKKIKVKI